MVKGRLGICINCGDPHAISVSTADLWRDRIGRLPGPIYTCPMYPQIRQNAPGNCRICGVALEPLLPASETGNNPELRDMTRRFWIGAVVLQETFWARRYGRVVGQFGIPWEINCGGPETSR